MRDAIAAVATGSGPIGIIRLSGEGTFEALSAVFVPNNGCNLSLARSRELIFGTLRNRSGAVIDLCYAVVFHAPATYTGEDMAEIQCHGSIAIMEEVLSSLFAQGVRAAEPGEYTKRAFLNGKVDLSGAEAVSDLIAARTLENAQNAAAQLMGAVGNQITDVRDKLLTMVAHFHAVIDFPDEDIDPFLFEEAQQVLHTAASTLYQLAESYERGRVLREGVPCVILGRPNVGKSTLLNTLLGRNRAIVTDVPGTTRDIIEETVRLGPVLLRISDTAGLRDTADPIEKEGISRALQQATGAAIILAVFDGSHPLDDDDLMVIARSTGRRSIAIVNKSDLPVQADIGIIKRYFDYVIPISAKHGDHVSDLTELIPSLLGLEGTTYNGNLITNARQAAALVRAASRCEEALFAAQSGMTYDSVVMDSEGAIAALGEVTGQSISEDIVSKIFSSFCVGK